MIAFEGVSVSDGIIYLVFVFKWIEFEGVDFGVYFFGGYKEGVGLRLGFRRLGRFGR